MESGAIADGQVSASSYWSSYYVPRNGRLNFKGSKGRVGAWAAAKNNNNQWLMVSFGKWVKVTAIATQGRYNKNQWVRSYRLSFSYDGVFFYSYKNRKVMNEKQTVSLKYSDQPIYNTLEHKFLELRKRFCLYSKR